MIELTSELLEQLEATAKAATPGPWRCEIGSFDRSGTILTSAPSTEPWTSPRYTPIACSHLFSERHAEDWTHIAAASPDVVLALVAAARKLERVTIAMEEWALCSEVSGYPGGPGTFIAAEIRCRMKEALHGD